MSDRYRHKLQRFHVSKPVKIPSINKRVLRITNPPNISKKRKLIIYTSADASVGSLLKEWVISLRVLGKFDGEVVVLDYGLNENMRSWLVNRGIRLIRKPIARYHEIVNLRHIDIIPFIKEQDEQDVIAHFDCDIWFQTSLDNLLEEAANSFGCICSTDPNWYTQAYHGPDELKHRIFYNNKISRVKDRYKGTIQGGFICAQKSQLLDKLLQFKECYDNGFVGICYGADQFLWNYLFNEDKDDASYNHYNCVHSDAVFDNVCWRSGKTKRKVIGVHVTGGMRHDKMRRFRVLHSDYIARLPDLRRVDWTEVSDESSGVKVSQKSCREMIRKLIGLSRKNQGLVIGECDNCDLLTGDVCSSYLIHPNDHDNAFYWDILSLNRDYHLKFLEEMIILPNIVGKLRDIESVYQFESLFGNYCFSLLSRLCGLQVGVI